VPRRKTRRENPWRVRPSEGGPTDAVVVERPLGEHWRARTVLVEREGRLVASRLEIAPTRDVPAEGLPMKDVHDVWLPGALLVLEDEERLATEGHFTPEALARIRQAARSGRGRAWHDYAYALVAEDYLEALRWAPTSPIKWLTEQYRALGLRVGRRLVTRADVRTWVNRAREYGWLTRLNQEPGKKRPGRAGGAATAKLRSPRWRARFLEEVEAEVLQADAKRREGR
jgi:hypothetical protein